MMVRLADRANLPALGALAVAMHDEAPNLRDVPLHEAAVAGALSDLVDAGTVVIAQAPDGGLAGFLLFTVRPEWWSYRLIAHELTLYVAPGHRGVMLANRLLAAAKARAAALGAVRFRGGTTAGTATEAACVVYARAGGVETGRAFEIDLASAPAPA